MSGENLSSERQEELRAAKSAEELEQIAEAEDQKLSDEMLEGVAGGYTNCKGFHMEDPHERCPAWCGWVG